MANNSLFYKQILQLEQNILSGMQHEDFFETTRKNLGGFSHSTFEGLKSLRECLPFTKFIPQYYSPTGFGKCNLTLVNNGQFMILAMYMDDISTEIHDHPFEGVFTPLRGNPVQMNFTFSSCEYISDHLESGELVCSDFKLLSPGDTVIIRKEMIHMLSRVAGDQFSLLVCRSLPAELCRNHFYLYPGLKIKNRQSWAYLTRVISILQGLPDFDQEGASELLKTLSPDELIQIFFRVGPELADKEMSSAERFNIRQLARFELVHSKLWPFITSHMSFLEKTKAKVSVLIS